MSAWAPIPYWSSTPEVSGADIAETSYTCFAGTRDAIEVRLVVRRVRPTPGSQLALFTTWDYHAMVTDRDGELAEVEADHRRHAIVEQSIAELKSAGLAHAPSGRFMANAAWLALAVMAHNLARAVGALAGTARATTATLRRQLFTGPGRLVRTARRLHLRLPTNWALGARVPDRPDQHQRPPSAPLTTRDPKPPTTKDPEKPDQPASRSRSFPISETTSPRRTGLLITATLSGASGFRHLAGQEREDTPHRVPGLAPGLRFDRIRGVAWRRRSRF